MNGLRVSLFLLTAIACVHCKSTASSSGTDDKSNVEASGDVQVVTPAADPTTVAAPPVNAVATATIAPPAPKVEVQPPRPSARHYWIPGHWAWNGGRYDWVGGHWDTVRGGHTYVAGHWVHHAGRYYYVDGAWH